MSKELNKFFKLMNKNGYFAKRFLSCCTTCSVAEVPDKYSDKYLVSNWQDKELFKEKKEMYMAWAGDFKEIKDIARQSGIKVKWDGKKEHKIILIDNKKEKI